MEANRVISPSEFKKVGAMNVVLTPMETDRKPGQYEFQNLLNCIFKQESETPNGGQGQPRSSDDLLF